MLFRSSKRRMGGSHAGFAPLHLVSLLQPTSRLEIQRSTPTARKSMPGNRDRNARKGHDWWTEGSSLSPTGRLDARLIEIRLMRSEERSVFPASLSVKTRTSAGKGFRPWCFWRRKRLCDPAVSTLDRPSNRYRRFLATAVWVKLFKQEHAFFSIDTQEKLSSVFRREPRLDVD